MDLGLTGKVAVVTGGASGMGASVGRTLAAEGARVVVADIQAEAPGSAVRRRYQKQGGDATFAEANVSVRAQVDALMEKTLADYGRIDILCNIAGPGASTGQLDTTEADYDLQLDGHLRGVFNCVQSVLPHMMERKYGKIISMGSFTAYGVTSNIPAYCAAFGGIIAYSKSVARFAAPYNINVNTVSPGNIYYADDGDLAGPTGEERGVCRRHPDQADRRAGRCRGRLCVLGIRPCPPSGRRRHQRQRRSVAVLAAAYSSTIN